jgi:hypothetical protein
MNKAYSLRAGALLLAAAWLALAPQAQAAQNSFTRGPFVQNVTTNSLQVFWRTALPSSTAVACGQAPAPEWTVGDDQAVTNHVVTLTNLAPGTVYSYQVLSTNEAGALTSPPRSVRTLRPQGPVFFDVTGDSASGNPVTTSLVARILADHPDLVVHLGDLVQYGWSDAMVGKEFFQPYQPALETLPFFMVVGNHETSFLTGGDPGATNFQKAFLLPTNSATGTELFYSFDHGDVHFVVLFNPWSEEYLMSVGDVQYTWLTNDLATTTKPWKLVFSHFPVQTCGQHYNDDYNTNHIWDQYEMMAVLAPVAEQFGVQMIFDGHDHCFQRFAPTNGLHHVINGSGGQYLYGFKHMESALAQFWIGYAYLRVNIVEDTLSLQAIDANGQVFDSLTVQKALPERQLYTAAWHTVRMATGPANDGDGNITNQVFDFIGRPLLPRAGQFSNLGQVYVNNDATNLYLGLSQVMTYSDNNLFLFLESPALPGVSSMAGVGNGVIDPGAQGADGLDCLENLSFTNFTPALGCLLGDEYADGQFRSFVRSNLALNIGQGVYRLDAALSDVPGVQLQQFNRSPQTGPVNMNGINQEQNADFIALAVPLAALGGIGPGDTIKLGILVGGPGYDPTNQTRQLDTSALAYSLTGSGMTNVVLEGVSVELAPDPQLVPPRLTITPTGPGQYQLSWPAWPGKVYDIEFSTSLTDFVRLDSRQAAADHEVFQVTSPGHEAGFFRVKLRERP